MGMSKWVDGWVEGWLKASVFVREEEINQLMLKASVCAWEKEIHWCERGREGERERVRERGEINQ